MKNNLRYALGAVAIAAGSASAGVVNTIDYFTLAFDTGVSTGFSYADRKSDNQSGLTLPSGFTQRYAQAGGTGSRIYSSGNGSVSGSVASGAGGFAQLYYGVDYFVGNPAVDLSNSNFSINLSNFSGGNLKFTLYAYSYSGGYSKCVVENVGSNGVIAFDTASFTEGQPGWGTVTWSTVTGVQLLVENTGSGVAQFGLSNFSVPAPGAIGLLGAAGLLGRRRRA